MPQLGRPGCPKQDTPLGLVSLAGIDVSLIPVVRPCWDALRPSWVAGPVGPLPPLGGGNLLTYPPKRHALLYELLRRTRRVSLKTWVVSRAGGGARKLQTKIYIYIYLSLVAYIYLY